MYGPGFSKGAAFQTAKAFAKGGLTAGTTYFPLSTGKMGKAGEAGTEGIFPLTRTADGDLGVRAIGGSGVSNINMPVTVNVQTGNNASGGASATDTRRMAQEIGEAVKIEVYKVIEKESRSGGKLASNKRGI